VYFKNSRYNKPLGQAHPIYIQQMIIFSNGPIIYNCGVGGLRESNRKCIYFLVPARIKNGKVI